VAGNPVLSARKTELLRRAGLDDLNYLRSMVGGLFFQQNPQEFVASTANQRFTDSIRTLDLGVTRFRAGRSEPLNQVLFFAEVYSRGGDRSRMFRTDTAGRLDSFDIPLGRDDKGYINRLLIDHVTYAFVRDDAGNVVAVDVQ
jgi:hypothetical protein